MDNNGFDDEIVAISDKTLVYERATLYQRLNTAITFHLTKPI